MARLKLLYAKLFAGISTVPPCLQPSHFPVLDGLRGLAILLLLFGHFGVNYYSWQIGLTFNGTTGVHIFFVLSGFLITTLLLKEKIRNGSVSLKDFYIRRALRILPVAWLFLLILAGLNYALDLHVQVFDFISAALFFKNMPMPLEPYTAHFWSLAVEVQFYLLFPLLLTFNTRWYTFISLAMVVLVPLVCVVNYFLPGFFTGNGLLHFIARACNYAFWKGPVIILIGSVFALLVFKGIVKPGQIPGGPFLSIALLLLALVIPTRVFVFYTKYMSEYISALLIGLALVITIGQKDVLNKILSTAFLTTLGLVSYSIFIWQELFIGPARLQPWMQYFTQLPFWGVLLVKFVFIAILTSFSFIFEARFLKLKDKFHYVRNAANKKAAP